MMKTVQYIYLSIHVLVGWCALDASVYFPVA